MAVAYLALSASLHDAARQLAEALARLDAHPDIVPGARSSVIATPPARRQRHETLTQVVAVETALKPKTLLDACLAVETAMGRQRGNAWAGQRIDIDLIAYDDYAVRSSGLTLPHPYAHSRPQVLDALREIAPDAADWVVERSKAPQ